MLKRSLSYRETAEALGLSWRTVQNHSYRAYAKLGVHSRDEAVRRASRYGLL